MKKDDVVVIDWLDACADERAWIRNFNFKEHEDYMHHVTSGFFIKRTKVATYVAQSKQKEGATIGGVFSIPNKCIIKIVKL